jgi:hypothetical protein
VLEFDPQPAREMLVACLWDRWISPHAPDLYPFAAITNEPTPEVAATGHQRTIITIQEQNFRNGFLQPGQLRSGSKRSSMRRILRLQASDRGIVALGTTSAFPGMILAVRQLDERLALLASAENEKDLSTLPATVYVDYLRHLKPSQQPYPGCPKTASSVMPPMT